MVLHKISHYYQRQHQWQNDKEDGLSNNQSVELDPAKSLVKRTPVKRIMQLLICANSLFKNITLQVNKEVV